MTGVLSVSQYVAAYVAAGVVASAVACAIGLAIDRLIRRRGEHSARGGGRKRLRRAAVSGNLSKGVQVGVSLTMISDESLASPEQIRMLSAWLAAHGLGPDDVMHILVPRTMCHDLRVARGVAASTIVSRVQYLYIAGGVLSFTDVVEPYLKWAKEKSLLPDGLRAVSLFDRTPSRASSGRGANPPVKEYDAVLQTSTGRRPKVYTAPLVVSDSLLFLKDQGLALKLKNSCVACGPRRRFSGCVEA